MTTTTLDTALVGPVISLASWTFFMEVWLYTYRLSDMKRYKLNPQPGIKLAELNAKIPRHRQWPADNFNHLHEQPTVFYAIALSLTVLEDVNPLTKSLAWGYVGTRVVHSLFQSLSNVPMTRWKIFVLSSALLAGMTGRAAWVLFT